MNTIKAIQSLRPNSEWVLRGDTIEWLDSEQTQPTEAEIIVEISRLQSEYETQTYARSRTTEYPSIGDQLDALFHAGVFPAGMAAVIQAVKDKYPKEAK
tara:strand:- start:270 stop:566 length:297 start_codon:yes stop_codon:yes gene_type:complete